MIYNVKKPAVLEDTLVGSKPSNCIPSGTPFCEMAYYVLEATENDFNDMMKNIGINELGYFVENGRELEYGLINVDEASMKDLNKASKAIFDGMMEWIDKAWSGAQEIIQKALDWLSERSAEINSTALKGFSDKKSLDGKVSAIKDDKKFGDLYTYSRLSYYVDKDIKSICDDSLSTIKSFTDAASKHNDDPSVDPDLADKLDLDMKKLVNGFCGGHPVKNIPEMSKYIREDIRGDKFKADGKWVKANWKTIMTEVSSYPDTKKKLHDTYNGIKSSCNKAKAECKAERKKLEGDKSFNASAFSTANKAYKTMVDATICAENAIVSCLNERYRAYASVVLRVATAAKSAKKAEEVQHNSAMMESSSSTVDMLNSLFVW